jgi:putative oxygen-independent coproporphyrinogen III oxidase
VPSALPAGDPAPADGALPPVALQEWAAAAAAGQPFGVYLHVPFCSTRCGYCDFNTYTAAELGTGVSRATYVEQVVAELELARRVLGDVNRPASTVFVGGGTPTVLPAADLARALAAVERLFGLSDGAEVTTEANPDSVTPQSLRHLRACGFNRVSFGMQSAAEHVLAVLERTHTPGRVAEAVAWARDAGFEQVSLDLIYGTPGESDRDWLSSLDAALALSPDHVSAYALVVEPGTRMAGRVHRGELVPPDDDVLADRYLAADRVLSQAGLQWYEVGNWAAADTSRCRHNLGYWRGEDWWGAGPGAHSHVGGVRWWNVKHPAAYAQRVQAGRSPAQAREVLSAAERRTENVLLGVRLRDGMPLVDVGQLDPTVPGRLADEGLLDPSALGHGQLQLTLRGRLLADMVVRELLP